MSTSEDIYCFVHFLKCLLNIDPKSRFTASQCLHHPFITKEKFDSFVLGSNNHFPFEENTSQPFTMFLVHKASNHKEFFIDLWNLDDLQ